MKRFFMRLALLFIIFWGGVIVFSHKINIVDRTEARVIAEPELPLMYMQVSGVTCNRMPGYVGEVDERTERTCLTPVMSDRKLTMQIELFRNKLKSLDYQITALTDGSVMQNGRISAMTELDGLQTAVIDLGAALRMDQEYMLRFAADIGRETPVYFYTRVVQTTSLDMGGYLDFVQSFTEACLNKEMRETVSAKLETDSSFTTVGFHELNIHSGVTMVQWGSLAPKMYKKPVPVIREVNGTTASVVMEYMLTATDPDNHTEYYTVHDFYRMRYYKETVALLDFRRSAAQIFDGALSVATSTGINLGVTNPELSYMASEDSMYTAFVVNGDVWLYNRKIDRLTKVLSFRQKGTTDTRTDSTDHTVRIGRVTNDGDIIFVLFGYIPSGAHEGQVGMSVYGYRAEDNLLEERVFIPLNQGFAVLNQHLSRLTHVTDSGLLYLFTGNALIRVDIRNAVSRVVQDGINPDQFMVSDSQSTVIWMDGGDDYTAKTVTVLNMETGKRLEIRAPEGERLKAVGFMNEDFVYGLARESDIVRDEAGNVTVGMYRICIQGADGEMKKQFQQEERFITGTVWGEGLLEMELSARTEEGFSPAGKEHILNNVHTETEVSLKPVTSDRKAQEMTLVFSDKRKTGTVTSDTAVFSDEGTVPEVRVDWPAMDEEQYFVYGHGELIGVYREESRAVRAADEVVGVVLDFRQQYVWERGNWNSSGFVNATDVPSVFLRGVIDEDQLQETLGDYGKVLNLSGCTLNNTFYQIAHGYPVIAATPSGTNLVILGYDNENIYVYTGMGANRAIKRTEAVKMFAETGNIFVSYMRIQ